MVGDSPSDVETARNAGAGGVVIVDGPYTAAATRAGADAVVGSVDELIIGWPVFGLQDRSLARRGIR